MHITVHITWLYLALPGYTSQRYKSLLFHPCSNLLIGLFTPFACLSVILSHAEFKTDAYFSVNQSQNFKHRCRLPPPTPRLSVCLSVGLQESSWSGAIFVFWPKHSIIHLPSISPSSPPPPRTLPPPHPLLANKAQLTNRSSPGEHTKTNCFLFRLRGWLHI